MRYLVALGYLFIYWVMLVYVRMGGQRIDSYLKPWIKENPINCLGMMILSHDRAMLLKNISLGSTVPQEIERGL